MRAIQITHDVNKRCLSCEPKGCPYHLTRYRAHSTISNASTKCVLGTSRHVYFDHGPASRAGTHPKSLSGAFRPASITLDERKHFHVFERGTVTVERHRDEVLESYVRLFTSAVGSDFILMDDNTRNMELIWSNNSWKAVTPKCLGCPPVDRDRRNAHPGL
ncbi:hypothetical protein TNCV_141941 [Trichonephila clavipes]|nr:hypothetical protein TNCV_141941 [Trichonephila clavipes]